MTKYPLIGQKFFEYKRNVFLPFEEQISLRIFVDWHPSLTKSPECSQNFTIIVTAQKLVMATKSANKFHFWHQILRSKWSPLQFSLHFTSSYIILLLSQKSKSKLNPARNKIKNESKICWSLKIRFYVNSAQ